MTPSYISFPAQRFDSSREHCSARRHARLQRVVCVAVGFSLSLSSHVTWCRMRLDLHKGRTQILSKANNSQKHMQAGTLAGLHPQQSDASMLEAFAVCRESMGRERASHRYCTFLVTRNDRAGLCLLHRHFSAARLLTRRNACASPNHLSSNPPQTGCGRGSP